MDKKQKAEEARLRRMADDRGYILQRSRLRKESGIEYGKYVLLDAKTGDVVAGGVRQLEEPVCDLLLSQVRHWLEHGELEHGEASIKRYRVKITPFRPRLTEPIQEVG